MRTVERIRPSVRTLRPAQRVMRVATILFAVALVPAVCRAELTRVDVTSRADLAAGRTFGTAGAYETVSGRAFFSVDPAGPHNQRIADLAAAPKTAAGRVEFTSDFVLVKPKDMAKANGVLVLDIANRGNKLIVRGLNRAERGATATDAQVGDGFLMEHGYTLLWVGWQGDLPDNPAMVKAQLPRALGIEGMLRADFTEAADAKDAALSTAFAYPPLGVDAGVTLTMRPDPYSDPVTVARDGWRFSPDLKRVAVDAGIKAGWTYEVVYRAKDPIVAGLGFAAVRDFVAAVRAREVAGVKAAHTIAFGESQSGRMLRDYLYEGFNAAENGSAVFDGFMIHIAGGARGSFTYRFAASGGDTYYYPTRFPFTADDETDPVTGQRDGILHRSAQDKVVPKIIFTNSAVEYWGGRGAALSHTTVDGKADAPQPENVRIYFLAGQQHDPAAFPPAPGNGDRTQQLPNPLQAKWVLRSLLLKMTAWIQTGAVPPPSRYPKIADGTLVAASALKYPAGLGQLPKAPVGNYRFDFGPEFKTKGIAAFPVKFGQPYTVLVPQVDADGNEVAGVRMPELAVPLATHTGWNFRAPSIGSPQTFARLIGSYVPFALTKAERTTTGDARLSVEERYPNRAAYLDRIRAAAQALVTGGYLLGQDVERLAEAAGQHWDWRHK